MAAVRTQRKAVVRSVRFVGSYVGGDDNARSWYRSVRRRHAGERFHPRAQKDMRRVRVRVVGVGCGWACAHLAEGLRLPARRVAGKVVGKARACERRAEAAVVEVSVVRRVVHRAAPTPRICTDAEGALPGRCLCACA